MNKWFMMFVLAFSWSWAEVDFDSIGDSDAYEEVEEEAPKPVVQPKKVAKKVKPKKEVPSNKVYFMSLDLPSLLLASSKDPNGLASFPKLRLGLMNNNEWKAYLTLGYMSSSEETIGLYATNKSESSLLAIGAGGEYLLTKVDGVFRGYCLGEFTYAMGNRKNTYTPVAPGVETTEEDKYSGFALNVGAGLEYFLAKQLSISGEGRVVYGSITEPKVDPTYDALGQPVSGTGSDEVKHGAISLSPRIALSWYF